MAETETSDVIEWRARPGWVLSWLAVMLLALAFLVLAAWLAAHEIAGAPEGTWPAYLFFLGAFATIILGTLTLAVLSGVLAYVKLLFDQAPVVRADQNGIEVRMPLRPVRRARWEEIAAIEVERTRKQGRYTVIYNHLLVRLHDGTAAELSIKPQMAGVSLEAGCDALTRLRARYR